MLFYLLKRKKGLTLSIGIFYHTENMRVQTIFISIFLGLIGLTLRAQGVSQQYINYIERYKGMAVDQMLRYKIPASITLAQGLLESGAGMSTLAKKANNHFGIKCGGSWKGPYILKDDDARNEKFRKYRSVEESYEDHSRFLKQTRYSSLFRLSPTDYKGWAHGLKKCGYATNPRYASLLINLIERYNLSQYDRYKSSSIHIDYGNINRNLDNETSQSHLVYKNNENYYIIARKGDTFDLLAEETGVSARNIRKYNELPKDYVLQDGDILYLERKRKKAGKKYKNIPHVVKAGESMYTIAQFYGIRLESLYDMNRLHKDYTIQVNDCLRVR